MARTERQKELARQRRQADKKRRAFIDEHRHCWVCGNYGTQCHEIACGPNRKTAIHYRQSYLALCPACHSQIHDYSQWPIERQAALKKQHDKDYYDLALLNELRGRHAGAITEADIAPYLERN